MRTFPRTLRIVSAITLFFFCWSFLPLWQAVVFAAETRHAAESKGHSAERQKTAEPRPVTSGEKFEKAVEDIRTKLRWAEDKSKAGVEPKPELEAIKAKKAELEALDAELKAGFGLTEKKLKDAKLKKEILDRHYKFVKHYQENLKELVANLTDIERGAENKGDLDKALKKAREHLERVKAPSHHQKLDPNNLPFRAQMPSKKREPRLKKEDFEKEFPPKKAAHSSSLIASNHELRATSLELLIGRENAREAQEFGNSNPPTSPFAKGGQEGDFLSTANKREWPRIKFKPVLLAYNDIASDVPFQLPLLSGETVGSVPEWFNRGMRGGFNPQWPQTTMSEIRKPQLDWDTSNADSSLFLLAQQAADLPSPDDLAEAPPAIQFTTSIRAKAQDELSCSPTKIFNWVHNNIIYEPYYGSFKSADQTLLEGAGNDFDQASLLISLMRVCNISAKYAYGTVEIPSDQAANMVGVTDPKTAATILATQGIPVKTVMSGGTIKAIQMERVWVEAWIDYFPSWGARHKTGGEDTWIPLDPSFKQYTYSQGMDMYALMGFNADQFLQSYITDTRDITAYQDYGKRLVDFIDTNYPDATIDQVFGASDIKSAKTIIPQEFPYLLGTLPYKTIISAAEFSQVPAAKEYAITIQIEGNSLDGALSLSYPGNLNFLAGNRITVSYEPATSADETLVANFGGNMLDVPPYLLNVKPVLKIAGTTVAIGAPIGLGQDQNIIISFAGPDGDTDRIQNIITAGNYSAIILQAQDTPIETPSKNMATLIENSKKIYPSDVSLDGLLGQMLYSIGVMYFHNISIENETYAKTLQLINSRQPCEAMVTHRVKVNYLFGLPVSAAEGGVNVDVDRNINLVASSAQDDQRIKAFMILSGLSSSAWENRILEVFLDTPSVSSIRLLKLASEQGIPIETITNENINELSPQLQITAEVKADISNSVNAGKKVIISRSNVTYNQWYGVGYIVIDPVTGAAGYMISGGLAGSDQSVPPSTPLRQGQLPDSTVEIRGLVLRIARAFTDTPYVWGGKTVDGFDCSGFVHEVFELAGPRIDEGNAAIQYDTCNKNKWLLTWNDRLAGDIIWKSDLKHVGIEAGANEISWRGNPYSGETAIHASGRPCYTDKKYAPKAPAKCISTSCELIDPTQPELGGNPPCGEFNVVIESPIGFFAKTRKDNVCRPK